MEKFKSYTKLKTEQKQNSNKNIKKEENEKSNTTKSKKHINHKRKNTNKETSLKKKIKTAQNSKNKNTNRRTYTKRTDLIQERIKILQLAKKNIDEEENNNNQQTERNKRIITDNINENKSKELKNTEIIQNNNLLLKPLNIEDNVNEKNNIIQKNISIRDKYIKKIPGKFSNSPEKITNLKKYDTSTFYYKISKRNYLLNKKNEKYNNYTYNYDKEIKEMSKEKKNNDLDMDMLEYKTGFIYRNKRMKDKNIYENSYDSPKNINSFIFTKAKSKKNNRSIKNINLLIKSENNIKEVKDEYDSNNEHEILNKEKELNNIYIPKKIHHLLRGSSQGDVHNLKKHNYANSNTTLKNRHKSYKRINNLSNNNNNNINININNNIKIITYNKKKPFWKMDKKEDNGDKIDKNFDDDDDRLDIFKDNISDISSIESRSNIESETTENNNKLNVYLNNIYKTKSIFHPKLYKKREDNNNIIDKVDKDSINNKYTKKTLNTQKTDINTKNSRNVSVPRFVFKKRITKDISEYNSKSNLKNNKQIVNNLNSMKNLKIDKSPKDNEPKFDEFVILNEKLKYIIDGIDANSIIINNLCFDFLNNFYQSSFLYIIEYLFVNKNLKIIKSYLKYLVFSVIMLYSYCAESPLIEENDKFLIQEIFSLNLQNILYLYEYIISKVKSKNTWANIIKEIIHNYKRQKKNIYSSNTNLYYQSVFDKIKNNTKYIRQIINRVFITNRKTNDKIISFIKDLENKPFIEIKNFFNKNIYQNNKVYGYIYPFSLYDDINEEFIQEKPFFNKKEKSKKYSLLLGLEDIILNLKLEDELESKGILRLRPGLISFLKEIQNYYEIIIFSLSENKIADYLINSIEKRNKYFDYRLYRENLRIVNDEFVIDLNQIGRPLDKIIIISNIPQIYQYNKENSINIKSYWEEDLIDNILNKLCIILKNIAKEEGDVRKHLLKYKDEIIKNITIGPLYY